MTSRDYIKVEQVRTWFLVLVLQSKNCLFLNAFFNFASVKFFLATWFTFSLCPWCLVVFCYVLHGRSGIFEVFCLKSSNCFPVKIHFFRGPFNFNTFCLQSTGFEIAPARGSSASVISHVMAKRDYIKFEEVRTWLLSSSLSEFKQFHSECFFFNFAPVNFFLATWFLFSFFPWDLVVILFCSPYDDWIFWFFGSKNSNCSALKLILSEGPSFFVRSVCNHGALKLRLFMAALPASLAMSWPGEFTKSWTGQDLTS